MRDIKFRAWDILNKKILNYADIMDLPMWEVFPGTPEQRCFEVMQYTGLKDKNGNEIYEGDIVELTTRLFIRIKCKVTFDCYGFMFEEINGDMIDFIGSCDTDDMDIIVIGNIYENPELLEG